MLAKYKAADVVMRPKAGLFWLEVGKMTTFEGQPRFNLLHKLMSGLMSIPVSNTDSERGFSILRKIHTDQRSNIDQSTIVALMTIKFNIDKCCLDIWTPSWTAPWVQEGYQELLSSPFWLRCFSWSFFFRCFYFINFNFLCTFLIRTNYISNQWVWHVNKWVWQNPAC